MDTTSYLLGKKAGGSGGTSDYSDLTNKPSINSVTLSGNKTSSDLGLQDTLTAGNNITIDANNVISASGGGSDIVELSGTASYNATNGLTTLSFDSASETKLQTIAQNYIADNTKTLAKVRYQSTNQINTQGRYFNVNIVFDLYIKGGSTYSEIDYVVNTSETQNAGTNYNYINPIEYNGEYQNSTIRFDSTTGTFSKTPTMRVIYLMSTISYSETAFGNVRFCKVLATNNSTSYTPSSDYNPATKKYVDDKLITLTGYDATKTQILKNINGTLTWVDE